MDVIIKLLDAPNGVEVVADEKRGIVGSLAGASSTHRVATPGYWALELAGLDGVDMTDPHDTTPPHYSTILAALLTATAGVDEAYNPIRVWRPREVAVRMMPEEMTQYSKAIATLIESLTAEIMERRGETPPKAAARRVRSTGNAKQRA